MPQPPILGDGNRVWFGPQAPLYLRFLLPDGSTLPHDASLNHTPSFYRLQRRTFKNESEALTCLRNAS